MPNFYASTVACDITCAFNFPMQTMVTVVTPMTPSHAIKLPLRYSAINMTLLRSPTNQIAICQGQEAVEGHYDQAWERGKVLDGLCTNGEVHRLFKVTKIEGDGGGESERKKERERER